MPWFIEDPYSDLGYLRGVCAPVLASQTVPGLVSLPSALCSGLWSLTKLCRLSAATVPSPSCWKSRRSLESYAGLRLGSHMSSASAVPLDNTPSSFSGWGRVLLNYLGCLSLPRSWGSRHILPCPACPACTSVNLLAFFLKVGSVAILCPLHLCMYFRNILSISTKKNAWILLGCDKSMHWFIENHNLNTTGYFNPRTWFMTAFV